MSVSIDALIRGLRERGHSVCLFTARSPGYRDPDPNTFRFFALETPWCKDYPLALPPFYSMLRHFRARRFDLIHTHTPFTLGFVGLRWGESHGIPVVSTYHTLYDKYAHYIPYFPKRYVRYKIAKHTNFYYNHVDHVITPSDASRRWLLRHAVKTPLSVIPTGIVAYGHPSRFAGRERLGLSPDARVLLYVGRIAKEKNMGTLFRGVAQVLLADPLARFLVVGDGPYRDACVQTARDLGIGDQVIFAGFVAREYVDEYYALSDIFVFSSTTETQGLVVMEAMQYGLPAVAVQGGGASAAIEDGVNGFVVRNDAGDFAEAIGRVLGDPLLYSRLSEAARITASQFGVEPMIDGIVDVYRQTLSTPALARAT